MCQFGLATFQGVNIHMWLVDTIFDNIALGRFAMDWMSSAYQALEDELC